MKLNTVLWNLVHSRISGDKPTIGVDVFKEIINDMTQQLNTNLINLNTKVDNITNCLNAQDLKINDLGQRVETLEKHLTYADAARSPPKPPTQTKPNTNTANTNATNTDKIVTENKNHNLTAEEIMNRSRNIIGIFPIHSEDIERNKCDTKEKTLINTATEFLRDELGFRQDQIEEMNITKVTKTKKTDGKTLYITLPSHTSVTQIFKRTAIIKNNNLKISNYVAPHFYNRYNTLQSYCKTAREMDDQLRTKITYGHNDIILQEKKIGEKHYTTVDIHKYGNLPQMDTTLIWPTQEIEIPLTTPPKGRPNQKRPLSSPEATPYTTVKHKKKKAKKNLNAESSISDQDIPNNSSDEENTNEVARMHKVITGKKTYTKKDLKKNQNISTPSTHLLYYYTSTSYIFSSLLYIYYYASTIYIFSSLVPIITVSTLYNGYHN